eukprot:scaffold97893_cov83-Attheya_sp.AAC.1
MAPSSTPPFTTVGKTTANGADIALSFKMGSTTPLAARLSTCTKLNLVVGSATTTLLLQPAMITLMLHWMLLENIEIGVATGVVPIANKVMHWLNNSSGSSQGVQPWWTHS